MIDLCDRDDRLFVMIVAYLVTAVLTLVGVGFVIGRVWGAR